MLTAVGTCYWRTAAGHRFLPGLFTVVFVPLSVALFLAVDSRAHFQLGDWIAVAAVISVHMVLSVPAFPGPLYYRGPSVVHPDHVMHVFAGGLVTWLWFEVFASRSALAPMSPGTVAVLASFMAMGLGALKETTDWLSVIGSGHRYNQINTVRDMGSNALGVAVVLLWSLRHRKSSSFLTEDT